jgi:Predicted integral membrane protein (DUF2269).
MFYQNLLILHSGALTAAIVLFAVGEVLIAIARGGARQPARLALLSGRVAGILMAIGVIAGIPLIYFGGWPLLSPWLVLSFILIAVLILTSGRFVEPWRKQARAAAQAGTEDGIVALARDRRASYGRLATLVLLIVIAAVMSLKPDLI